MKLARTFTFALALLGLLVLIAFGTFQVRYEWDRAVEDTQGDHRLLGLALDGAITHAAQAGGMREALSVLDQANRYQDEARFEWVWLDRSGDVRTPLLTASRLAELRKGEMVSVDVTRDRTPLVVSWVPAVLRGERGAIQITEPLSSREQQLRQTVFVVGGAGLLLCALYLVAAAALGHRIIGRPVAALARMARRVGEDDLDARVHLARRDELGELGRAMNQMAESLSVTRERLSQETRERLVTLEHLRHAERLGTVGKLAAGVAHELGTPLNVVHGRAKMIAQREVEGEEARDSANVIAGQAQAMTRIIRQLLDFARRREPQRTEEPLAPLVARTLELLQPMATRRGVALVSTVGAHYEASIDAGQIQQVMANLVLNAIQAMHRPGLVEVNASEERRPPQLESGAERDWIRIDVVDHGEGIPPDVLPRIFEPFFTTKGVGDGTGLGLSVTWGLVRDHGGWIDVVSSPGKGTRVSVFLPKEAP